MTLPVGAWTLPRPAYTPAVRGLTALAAACALLRCIWLTPMNPRIQWDGWVILHVVLLLFLPPLLGALLFDQKPGDLGFTLGDWRAGLKWTLGGLVLMTPLLVYASGLPDFQAYYPRWPPAGNSLPNFLHFCWTITLYMLAWEYLFRGFLLHALAPACGWLAIFVQAIPFGLMHFGKVPAEIASSFFGAAVLGFICWRCRSFLPGFLIHTAINIGFTALIIWRIGGFTGA